MSSRDNPGTPAGSSHGTNAHRTRQAGNGKNGTQGVTRAKGPNRPGTTYNHRQMGPLMPTMQNNSPQPPNQHLLPTYYLPQQYVFQSQYPEQWYSQAYRQYPLPQTSFTYLQHYTPQQLPTHFPKYNAHGYTLSATAYSLPEHHYRPAPSDRPDLSEEELRHSLEQASKKRTSILPIQGTNIRLVTVDDIMAWRAERKRKWLTNIAGACGPVRNGTRRGPPQINKKRPISVENAKAKRCKAGQGRVVRPLEQKAGERTTIEDKDGEFEEGEVVETVIKDSDVIVSTNNKTTKSKNTRRKRSKSLRGTKGNPVSRIKKREITTKVKKSAQDQATNVEISKSLYSALLQNQMERENIIFLQALLCFREDGLLDLEM